jgi:Lsr2
MLRDDIDGGSADRTVAFVWGGAGYEIDLSKKNLAEFEAILTPYIAAARRVGGRAAAGRGATRSATRRRSTANGAAGSGVDLAAVRSWAAANGHAVAARGRISATVLDAYATRGASSGSSRSATATTARKRAATKSTANGRRRAKSVAKTA